MSLKQQDAKVSYEIGLLIDYWRAGRQLSGSMVMTVLLYTYVCYVPQWIIAVIPCSSINRSLPCPIDPSLA